MRTSLLKPSAAALLATLGLVAPAGAADYYVPPSNSAATQYTESFPSAKGDRNAERDTAPRGHSPERALGDRTAQRLEQAGPSGEAVAEVVVETAPSPPPAAAEPELPAPRGASTTSQRAGGEDARTGGSNGSEESDEEAAAAAAARVDGSSGGGAILAGAFGASTGGSLLLPLAILATAIWALAYARRRPSESA